jgi:phage tail sheath protein FI
MPVTPTYPGVYVEEISSGVRTITGVATAVAAFVDHFKRGPLNRAVQLFNWGDFVREFGGLDAKSEASYALQQFFLNGGGEAWAVRVAAGTPVKATALIAATAGGATAALTVTAISEGEWGRNLRVAVDAFGAKTGEFNLTFSEFAVAGGASTLVNQEVFRNLSIDKTKSNSVESVVNDANSGSKLVRVAAAGAQPPLINGTQSGDLATFPALTAGSPQVDVTIGSEGPFAAKFSAKPATLAAARTVLEAAIRAAAPDKPAFSGATVAILNNTLLVLAGPGDPSARAIFAANAADATSAGELRLTTATANVQVYKLGLTAAIASTAQLAGAAGSDGALPDAMALIGDSVAKTGLFALADVDLFNILCIPRTSIVSGDNALNSDATIAATQAATVIATATQYCAQRRAFFVVDTPNNVSSVTGIRDWLNANATLRNKNAALYFPRVKVGDPLNDFRLRSIGASGTVAGLYARTDSARGVWKAPAGTEASLVSVQGLDYRLTDPENGALNPLAINSLRNFPIYGNVAWGARTLDGADQQASEWKYVPVRRLALFLEESLYRGLKWVVFEPNDEPLWAQIRLNAGAFMHNLFRQGAFQGATPREAYFVKCDKETTTQNDRNLGIVNILVGFAPLKPAEFVIIKLQQMAGQIEG